MIFALGACVAGLLGLLCLPAISRRAMRFAQAAAERQMPISVDEIVAQRDLLRAEFATKQRGFEQAVDNARAALTREMETSGRRAAEIGRLSIALSEMTVAHTSAEAARLVAERNANETGAENGSLQKGLYDAEGLMAKMREALAALRRDHDALLGKHERATASVAALEAHVAALNLRIDDREDAARIAMVTESDLRAQIAELEKTAVVSGDIATLRRTIVEIGHEVVRLARQTDDRPADAAERTSRARQLPALSRDRWAQTAWRSPVSAHPASRRS